MSAAKDLHKIGWEPLLARLDADVARAEADSSGQRDEAAWKELRRRADYYAGAFARTPFARMKTALSSWELDDVVQEVCIKLQRRAVLAQLRGARKPAGYLVSMLRSAAADHLRGGAHRVRIFIDEKDFSRLDAEGRKSAFLGDRVAEALAKAIHWQDESTRERALRRAVEHLSDADRALLLEFFLHERPLKEIATALGISYSAVAGRLRRLKERVRAFMEGRNRTP